jgi:acyl-coenzyme A thioesterase PaaI-like protein
MVPADYSLVPAGDSPHSQVRAWYRRATARILAGGTPVTQTKALSLQQQFAPQSICFGCGPANKDGLHIGSFPEGDTCVCEWLPEPKYQAFTGVLYGGLVASLLDCHCNWTAAWHLMKQNGQDKPPSTVTAELNVKYKRPTPADKPIRMVARVLNSKERSANIEGELWCDGELCATVTALFVAVKPDHPAYHRW